MYCRDCNYFKIIQEPLRVFDGIYDAGVAECKLYNKQVDFLNKGKLKRLTCIKEEETGKAVTYEDLLLEAKRIKEARNNIGTGATYVTDLTPCNFCVYNPPSSGDGKPCTMCPAQAIDQSKVGRWIRVDKEGTK